MFPKNTHLIDTRPHLEIAGHSISLATIHRIAADLFYRWQKPWYTDLLTPAQKLKRKLFCAELLRLSEEQLLRKIAEWMFTDEKWWDIVGPAMYKYVKAGNKAEGKMGNKVWFIFVFFVVFFFILLVFVFVCIAGATAQK